MMPQYDPAIHHRRNIRLKGYDYSQNGAYFITVCTQNRKCLFGEIADGAMQLNAFDEIAVGATLVVAQNRTITPIMKLNAAGDMIITEWVNLKKRFPTIELYEYVVMPNHFHAIIQIISENETDVQPQIGQPQGLPLRKNIGDFVAAFKSITTNEYIHMVKSDHWLPFEKRLWQRNYYEHIIRDDAEHASIAAYIANNPLNWRNDGLWVP